MSDNFINLVEYRKPVRLEIGLPLQLSLDGIGFPLYSVVAGMEQGEYLAIKLPAQSVNIRHKLIPGAEIVVRYLHDGTVYGFQTKLIDIISKPAKLIFLEYPKIIEEHELRQHKRAQTIFPALIYIGDNFYKGAILDISKNGCRFHILNDRHGHVPIAHLEDQIRLACRFPGIQGEIAVEGIIRNITKNKKELILGLEFHIEEEDLHEHISKYIYDIKDFT